MKKLFTTILMMGVALCSWADPSINGELSSDGKTLTITYVADESQPDFLTNLKAKDIDDLAGEKKDWEGVETLVLVGDFANKDLSFISDKFVANCVSGPGNGNKKIFLNLSGCTGMKSKVVKASDGTWNADIDWVTTEHKFIPDPANPEYGSVTYILTQKQERNVTILRYGSNDVTSLMPEDFINDLKTNGEEATREKTYVFQMYGNSSRIGYYEGGESYEYPNPYNPNVNFTFTPNEDGWYIIQGTNGDKLTVNVSDPLIVWYDSNDNVFEVPEGVTPTDNNNGTFTYIYTYPLDASVFKFKDGSFNNIGKLSGIAFPSHADFNYIPEGLCLGKTGLTNVIFGAYTEWIGAEAFSGCTALTNPKYNSSNGVITTGFPATMKVFGGDSFKECNSFTKVDLSVLPKIQIVDYMAFGSTGTTEATSNLAEFILPTSKNTSLKYFANYVIRGTKVKKLDFTYCEGIVNFAHDGKTTFGEFSANWDSYWTFYGSSELEEVILPPNLSYLTKNAFNTCPKLQSVTFLGDAVYDKSTCVEGGTNTITNPLIIDEDAFNKDYALTTVVFCNRVTEIRQTAFQNTGLTSVTIPASVEVIGVRAFSECTALTTVTFEEIADGCEPCKHAKTVIAGEHRVQATDPDTGELLFNNDGTPIYEQVQVVVEGVPQYDDDGNPIMEDKREGNGNGAFFNCKNITDIYINAPDAEIICENKAFDYDISFGQTNPDAKFATLHYPEGEEEKYVNLQHYLTDEIANTPGLFQAWLQEHFNFATKPNNNGWHEFINSGPSSLVPDTIYNSEDGDVILRTYSDHYARIVPNGIKAYIVNKVALNDDGNYELTLQSLRVIPAETGVILYGQPNANAQGGGKTLAMTAVEYAPDNGYPLRRDYWDMLATELTQQQRQEDENMKPDAVRMKNYLMPIIDNGKIRNATTVGVFSEDDLEDADLQTVLPYEKENGQVIFRNFALNRFNTTKNLSKKDEFKDLAADVTNYAGFFRILKGKYASGYAYLHLTSSEYEDPEGAECLVIKDDLYSYEYKGSSFIDFSEKTSLEDNPNRYWQYAVWEGMVKDWGVRDASKFNLPKPGTGSVVKYLGEVEEEADGIVKLVVPANESGDFFNLQGVKVTNPTKGVYVRNGKKVIIK